MKLFKSPSAIVDETRKLRKAENFRRMDRGIVSNFYNGAAPLTDEEAEDLGFTVNANHLFGWKEIQDASEQVFGLYHKPSSLVQVELDAAPPGRRTDIGFKASSEASRVFKKITGFKTAYQGVAGDGSLHGEALFFYPNKTFPLPRQCPLSKMLIPDDSSTDVTELTHFAIEHPLSLKDLRWYWERAPKGWNKANLGKCLSNIYKNCMTEGITLDPTNLEEMEYRRQENSALGSGESRRRPGVDVVYFYQQRPDLFGCPYDLTIIMASAQWEWDEKNDAVLYSGDGCIENIRKCLHPFFMDCIIGGAPRWHRVLGTGHLNYQTNHAVELLVNRAQQATMEGSMNLWQARDTATREAAEKILMKHNGILPEGLNLVPNRFEPNMRGILEMVQFFRQAGSKNARGITPNNGDKNDQLEVQAIAEMNAGATASGTRTSNWYDYLDTMWTEAFARLTNPFIDADEPGYSEVMDFQGAMARERIPLGYLQPDNVQVKAARIVGDGLRAKEVAAVQYLTTNRAQYAPEVQPKITRICTGLALDNYRLAEELTPIQETPDQPQLIRVDDENAVMLTMRRAMSPKPDDIDELHVMGHFPVMELLIKDGLQFQQGAFTPQQAESFQQVGGHIMLHIQRIEGRASINSRNDPDREKAAAFSEQLAQFAALGEKLMKNMQQPKGQEQEMSQAEIAKLQLDSEKLSLAREKLQHAMAKFERTQGTREQALAFDQMLKLEGDRRATQEHQRTGAVEDTRLALDIATAGHKTNGVK